MKDMKIILASGSPRRKELMKLAGFDFEVITSNTKEVTRETLPERIVEDLSYQKAVAVYTKLKENDGYNNECIIGADTIVYNKGEVLGKPADEEDAFRMISNLKNGTHQVYTGVTFIKEDKNYSFYEKTDVNVYDMSDDEIRMYIASKEPMDKAGAYGIQGGFAVYVKSISGDYNNVVGLPIARLVHELKNFWIDFV